jgi:hypothetical protein
MEINLFFQRIMKEHLFFIETNLQPVEIAYIKEANMLKQSFEQLLAETVYYASGVISEDAVKSNEIVTPYTLRAEQVNSMLTGARLNIGITRKEYELVGIPMRAEKVNPMLIGANLNNYYNSEWLESVVHDLNRRSYYLLEKVIAFKKNLLALVSECKIFITLYHEMLEHDTREAEYYLEILNSLQNRDLPKKTLCEELNFWNNIMGEHAQFIDGMLDPTEKSLKETAEASAKGFEKLVEECIKTAENQIIQRSLESTEEIRDFKRESTEGLLKCKIKSIIPPLLADHVLREANHYLRLLKVMKRF